MSIRSSVRAWYNTFASLTKPAPSSAPARPQKVRPSFERLEDRVVPSLTDGLPARGPTEGPIMVTSTGGQKTLEIFGTSRDDVVTVRDRGNQIRVTFNGTTQSFTRPSNLDRIIFWGKKGNDTFRSFSATRVEAHGDIGHDLLDAADANDSLYGGQGNDTLMGWGGRDELQGGADHDCIYGGSGRDALYGGGGHDGLFGGEDRDDLTGGGGNDRFLTVGFQTTDDTLVDLRTHDVQLQFSDNFTDKEIQVLDGAFFLLQEAAGWNTIILEDTVTSVPLYFFKMSGPEVDDPSAIIEGSNDVVQTPRIVTSGPWWNKKDTIVWENSHRQINIENWDAGNDVLNAEARLTVIHEIGHNWDENQQVNRGLRGGLWTDFLSVSGWTMTRPSRGRFSTTTDHAGRTWYYRGGDNDFFGHDDGQLYGRTSPFEDFATTWEAYFEQRVRSGSFIITDVRQAKLDVAHRFFTAMSQL